MKLIPNWHIVLRYAWSVRLIVLAGVLTGLESILPVLPALVGISPQSFAGFTFLIVMAALVARFIAQERPPGSEP